MNTDSYALPLEYISVQMKAGLNGRKDVFNF